MTATPGILTATPIWVWAVLVLLVWLGMIASRTRTVGLPRLLATPLAFIAWIAVAMAVKPGWRDGLSFWDVAFSGASARLFHPHAGPSRRRRSPCACAPRPCGSGAAALRPRTALNP